MIPETTLLNQVSSPYICPEGGALIIWQNADLLS